MSKRARDTPSTRTLQRAAEALGGDEKLAQALGVPLGQLLRWSSGLEAPSIQIFCAALDIVAAGRIADSPRILQRAIEIAGDAAKLCQDLRVEPYALQLWRDGRATPPIHVLRAAIDLIMRDTLSRTAEVRQLSADPSSGEPDS